MANSGFAFSMPRNKKAPELRTIDEEAEKDEVARYYRLDPEQGVSNEQAVVKLDAPDAKISKLEVPVRNEVETRTIEPGVENLITTNKPTLEQEEAQWGGGASGRRPILWGWFALIGVLLAGLAIWAFIEIRRAGEQLDTIRVGTEEMLKQEEASALKARSQIERIEHSLRVFTEAPDMETMATVVRHPERVRPLMKDHYSRHDYEPIGPRRVDSLRPLTLGSMGDFWMVTLESEENERMKLLVQAPEDAEARVDWETAVCYQPMDWDDYARERPHGTTMDFRVFIEPDTLYSHDFRDSEKWDSFLLTALDSEEVLFGYIRSDNPSAELLRTWFGRFPSRPAAMVLRLSLPEGLQSPRGVVIDEVLAIRWIYIVPPTKDA